MKVWLLLSTGVVNVPDPHPGEDPVQTRAFAYATREAALGALRGFVRSDLAEANSEDRWRELGCTVDDELCNVLGGGYGEDDGPESDKLWAYDGTLRSYEWRLLRLGVRGGESASSPSDDLAAWVEGHVSDAGYAADKDRFLPLHHDESCGIDWARKKILAHIRELVP